MEIRIINNQQDFTKVIILQKRIWGFSNLDCVPPHLLAVANKIGWLYGAFIGDELIGFIHAFSTSSMSSSSAYSHMLGVSPDFQNLKIGQKLMEFQVQTCLEAGIRHLNWTFDPLEAINAHLYIGKFGGKVVEFLPNFYGDSMQGRNSGSDTDRFMIELELTRSQARKKTSIQSLDELSHESTVLQISSFESQHLSFTGPIALEIPFDFQSIKKQDLTTATLIRTQSRLAFQSLLRSGKKIKDFTTFYHDGARRAFYLTD